MLKLKPSARARKRYLLIQGKKENIEKAILDYVGILGYAKASPVFTKKGENYVLTVNRREIDKIRGAFAISADKIKILKVSGTLKGIRKR